MASSVRVVSEEGNLGVFPVEEAVRLARERSLDLVEVSPAASPPVCRIVDYSKFKYERKKKLRDVKSKSSKVVLKEIRFGPNTDDHDFDFKVKHALSFLKEGSKVKAYVHFPGRSILFKERGEEVLRRFVGAMEAFGKVEQEPKMEGKRMHLVMAPLSSKV